MTETKAALMARVVAQMHQMLDESVLNVPALADRAVAALNAPQPNGDRLVNAIVTLGAAKSAIDTLKASYPFGEEEFGRLVLEVTKRIADRIEEVESERGAAL